jgi:hypothetical protein
MTGKLALPHEQCVYCLDERDGCCAADCHPDRECQSIAGLTAEKLVYGLRQNRPLGPG